MLSWVYLEYGSLGLYVDELHVRINPVGSVGIKMHKCNITTVLITGSTVVLTCCKGDS